MNHKTVNQTTANHTTFLNRTIAFIYVVAFAFCLSAMPQNAYAQRRAYAAQQQSIASSATQNQPPVRLRFESLNGLAAKASDTTDIELDGAMLEMATKFLDGKDAGSELGLGDLKGIANTEELREIAKSLTSVAVKTFEFKEPNAFNESNIAPLREQLTQPGSGWRRMAHINSKGKENETVEIYSANDAANANRIGGLAVLVVEPKSLVVVSITGSLDPNLVMRMMGKLTDEDFEPAAENSKNNSARPQLKSKKTN